MKLQCGIGLHNWKGCKCSKCEKVRDSHHNWSEDCAKCSYCQHTRIGFHNWVGCKCSVCGKAGTENHDWSHDCEICFVCKSRRHGAHTWNPNCTKCTTCGKAEEGHDWTVDCTQCDKCGKTRNREHDWSADCEHCARCNATRRQAHIFAEGALCRACGKLGDRDTAVEMLLRACAERDVATLRSLLAAGADPHIHAWERTGGGVLLRASRDGHAEVVACLLEHCGRAEIRVTRSDGGLYALHYAAAYGHLEVVCLLLDTPMHHSDGIFAVGDRYINYEQFPRVLAPIEYAVIGEHAEVVRALLQRGSRLRPWINKEWARNSMGCGYLEKILPHIG
jgi:hypothetical protein